MKHWQRATFAALTTLSVLAMSCAPAHAEPVTEEREAPAKSKVVTTSNWTEISAETAEGIIAGDQEVIDEVIESTQNGAMSRAVSFSPEGCKLSSQYMHVRSDTPRNIGFKPTTACNSRVQQIHHTARIERQTWILWSTIWSGSRWQNNTHKWTQLDISKVCRSGSPYNTYR